VTAAIVQLSVSRGGVPKRAVPEARITTHGLVGDVQNHTKIHGGPSRAVCLFALEVIERLRAEGHPIAPGATGENITIRGLDWPAVVTGTRLALGDEVVLEITGLTDPCKQIAAAFADRQFRRILAPGASRLYARVVREGGVRTGDRVALVA
jgi:MOSC domain-containing protein YiiM